MGGAVQHVINRGCGRMTLFHQDGDYAAFEAVLAEAVERFEVKLLAYCVMPNHWHLVMWPEDGERLSKMLHWLTMTHVMRWRNFRKLVGLGPLPEVAVRVCGAGAGGEGWRFRRSG